MEHFLEQLYSQVHWSLLGAVIAVSLAALAKAGDRLVDEAVALSEKSHVPKIVIGATIVSVGTTTPEAAVSVFAAVKGSPGLALGNAVGSIICDTGLILGIACVIAPLRLDRKIVNRQGRIQLAAALAIVIASFPWRNPSSVFATGGVLPQFAGFLFLVCLAAYLWLSVRWARRDVEAAARVARHEADVGASSPVIVIKLLIAVAVVVISAQVLIPAVAEAAARLRVPDSVIAATLVAFGTSLPELVTAVSAARRGHGELAVGNIVGADILNVLFVSGAAAAVTAGGLRADGYFFAVLYPIMLFVLLVFRVGIVFSGQWMKRPFGFILLGAYSVYLVVSYVVPSC